MIPLIGAETLAPVGVIAETFDDLGLVLEGEFDQGIGFPVAGGDFPDRGLVGVEVPLAGGADALPVHAQAATIAHVFGDHTGGLDSHHRHGVAPGFKGQAVLFDVDRLDDNALACLHGAHLGQHPAVVLEVVLPDAFVDEAIGLVVATVDHGADEPAGGCRFSRRGGELAQHRTPPVGPHETTVKNVNTSSLIAIIGEMKAGLGVSRRIWQVMACIVWVDGR